MVNMLLLLTSLESSDILMQKKNFKLFLEKKPFFKQNFEYINELNNDMLNYIDVIVINNLQEKNKIENIINSSTIQKKIYLFSTFQFNITNPNCEFYNYIKYHKIISFLDEKTNILKTNTIQTEDNVSQLTPSIMSEKISYNIFKFRRLCLSLLSEIKSSIPEILINQSNEAVYIEYRNLEHSEVLIRNCILKLGTDWSFTVICGEEAFQFYKNMCKNIHQNIKVINTGHKIMTQNIYNNLLLTKDFWNLINGEKVLIYQEDSFIFKDNINDFMKCDYVGAPFKMDCVEGINVGCGGLSLRSRSKMIEVIDKVPFESVDKSSLKPFIQNYIKNHNLDNIPEDIYYSTYLQKMGIGKVADFETAKKFSSDTIYDENSFGMHCMWNGCTDCEKKINNKIRVDDKSQLSIVNECEKYKTLFHKYYLNISDKDKSIPYLIIKKNTTNNKFICNFHIFDLDNFINILNIYLFNLIKEFDVIITFCKGNYNLLMCEDVTLLKISNAGYDIGGKLVSLEYLQNENIDYSYILFLHSKSCIKTRNKYFNPLIKNLNRIKLIKTLMEEKDIYGVFPNCMWYNEDNNKNYDVYDVYKSNIEYYNDMLKYLKMNDYKVFSEGNCFICNKNLIDFIFNQNYKLFYNILNNENSFDVNWFNIYYKCENLTTEESYNKFKNENLYGNNMLLHKKKNSLPDGMIEHLFERIWITAIKHLNKKYIILDSENTIETYNIKINALYFPQFHEIPENNKFWGDGFTEWTLLKPYDTYKFIDSSKYDILKPHTNIGYYNLEDKHTLLKQIDIANNYNINGFVIYHYWFDNSTKVMYKPLEQFLNSDIKFPFCISWANETWSRRWDGSNKEVLIEQKYGENNNSFLQHINYLINFFKMPNYIKSEKNECIFYIYNFENNLKTIYDKMMICWNAELNKHNLKIKVIITENSSHNLNIENDKFLFEPMHSCSYVNLFNTNIQDYNEEDFDINYYKMANIDLKDLNDDYLFKHFITYGINENRIFKYKNEIKGNSLCINYKDVIDNYKKNKYVTDKKHLGLPLYWNNIIRRKDLSFLYVKNFTLENLEELLILLIAKIVVRSSNIYNISDFNVYDNVININAWNEWNEQAVLEPNNITGYDNLETISNIIKTI